MKRPLLFTLRCVVGFSLVLCVAASPSTPLGIPLDAPWKHSIYQLAHSKFIHPAWGWQHSERNYVLATQLARDDGMKVDSDVLFAAAFLHDMSAFMPCKDTKMEHGDCAAQQSGPILQRAGFPMQKLAAVQAAERGHMYYSDAGTQPEAIVLHDADSLDFLGDIGAARLIALTGEHGASFDKAIDSLKKMADAIPPKLLTRSGKALGEQRAKELRDFIARVESEESVK